jgi:hypothetical protein
MKLSNLMMACSILALTGCGDSKKDLEERVPLHGMVYDGNTGVDPLVGCWVFVDDGSAEVLTTQSGADGTFSVDVRPGVPLTITVGRSDRLVVTFVGVDPATLSGPVVFPLWVRDPATLPTPDTMTISGTLNAIPASAGGVFFYGNDQGGQNYRPTSGTGPASFTFSAAKCSARETLGYTAVALNSTTAEVYDAAVFTVNQSDPQPVDITFTNAAPVDLVVTTNQPVIDGAPITTASATYSYWHVMTSLVDPIFTCGGSSAMNGFAKDLTASGSDLVIHTPYVPLGTYTHTASINLCRDYSDPTAGTSWANELLTPGATTLNVDMFDTPDVDRTLTLKPGRTLTWSAIDGAAQYRLVMIADNIAYWAIITTKPEAAIPRLPAGFDPTTIAAGGGWLVRAYSVVPLWDHVYKPDEPFKPAKGSVAMGSVVQLTP